jgi:Cu/Ag efflux pump CusA
VLRDGGSRRIDVTCDASGRDLGGVARDVREVVAKIAFPEGHHAEVLGQHEARERARRGMVALSVLSLVGIALVLYADFRSTRLVLFVMGTLPFALVGGIAGVLATGGVVSLGSLVGLVTVLGIAARNGILLVGHFRHLEREEGVAFGRELVVRGARERVVPVVMTALTTALALVPLVVVGEKPGNEIERPMAIVILGGLVSSTLLCLTLVPALYLRFGASPTRERD